MDVLTVIYLIYSFVSFYFLVLFSMIYFPNRKNIYKVPDITKIYSLSVVVPCYNEEKNIRETVDSLFRSDYPGLKKVIIVDDCSTDSSWKIIQEIAKENKKVLAVKTPHNTGKASGSKNYGARFANTDLIGFTDGDSFPEPEAISKMIGFFDNKVVGGVTSMVLVKNRDNLLMKFQTIEYKMIAFSRKLLGFVDSIYVTPGPLAIYRKKVFDEVKGFDERNLTEDIEITWAIVKKGYKIEMAFPARVYSVVPTKVKQWIKQRIRWNIGGIQTANKYKKYFGSVKVGMLGKFILPYFIFNWFLGLIGIGVLIYRIVRALIIKYFSVSYSVKAQAAILTFKDISLVPNILFFFGVVSLLFNFFLVTVALSHSRKERYKTPSVFNVSIYFFFYLLTYPIILLTSFYKFFRGKHSW